MGEWAYDFLHAQGTTYPQHDLAQHVAGGQPLVGPGGSRPRAVGAEHEPKTRATTRLAISPSPMSASHCSTPAVSIAISTLCAAGKDTGREWIERARRVRRTHRSRLCAWSSGSSRTRSSVAALLVFTAVRMESSFISEPASNPFE
jgi:hypothetical protein